MRRILVASWTVAALVGLPPASRAQTAGLIPIEALAAEGREAWAEALERYRAVLAREPGRADILLRVADIQARLGNTPAAIEALARAVDARRDDPELYARLSRAYASVDQPAAALAAIQAALVLRPEDPGYLDAAGRLGSWSGDYAAAREALERLIALQPGNTDARLALARVLAWDGRTDRAAAHYRRYLDAVPGDTAATLEAARAESWRGDDAGAVSLLNRYRVRFGDDGEWRREMASVLTRARRPRAALAVLRPLLAGAPEYDVHVLHARARMEHGDERAARRAHAAASLLDRQRRETADLARQLRRAFGSILQPSGVGYGDSDGLRSYRLPLSLAVALAPGVRVQGGYERQELRARIGSGLERLDGGRDVSLDRGWAGVELRPWTPVIVRGEGGRQDSVARQEWTWSAGIDLRPADTLRLQYDREHSLMTISPRAVSLGLVRDVDRVRAAWSPSLVFALDADASREALSDGNQRRAFRLAPRVAVVRHGRLNLDLGASASLFAAGRNLDHGYYDPSLYEVYAVTLLPYFKFSENHGLSVFAEIGAQRDDAAQGFEPGGSFAAELSMGIYQAWMLKLHGSATINSRLESGAFQGFSGGVVIVRRF